MLKKAFYYIVNTLSVIIIAAALFILLSVVLTNRNEPPNVLGYSAFRVVTGSMEPSIEQGELIVVKRQPASAIAVGDVITFYSQDPQLQGAINTHRVTGLKDENGSIVFSTKGDANEIEDRYPVKDTNLIGKVVFSSSVLGNVSRLAANPLIFIPLILVPLLAILLSNMIKTVRLAKEAVRVEEEKAVADVLQQIRQRKAEEAAAAEQNRANEKEDDITP